MTTDKDVAVDHDATMLIWSPNASTTVYVASAGPWGIYRLREGYQLSYNHSIIATPVTLSLAKALAAGLNKALYGLDYEAGIQKGYELALGVLQQKESELRDTLRVTTDCDTDFSGESLESASSNVAEEQAFYTDEDQPFMEGFYVALQTVKTLSPLGD